MAKKEKIPAIDIIDVISKYETEIAKECNPEPIKVLEYITKDSGEIISKYLCGHCHSVFNELPSKWLSGIRESYCPICHNKCTGSLIHDNEYKKEIAIVIQENRSLYFAIVIVAFFYDDNMNIADSKFEYQNVGIFDLDTNEKSFYKFKPTTGEHIYTTAQAVTLVYYSHYRLIPNYFIKVTDPDLHFIKGTDPDLPYDYYSIMKEIDKRKKSIAKKKEEVPFPAELDDEPECPDVADILNIAVVCKETDEVLKKKTYKAKCLHCNNEWLFDVDKDIDKFLAECPYCGASRNVNNYYRDETHFWMYVSDSKDTVVVKIVQTGTELCSLTPSNYKGLVGYYVFNRKGTCNGFTRRMYFIERPKFSSWERRNYNSAQNTFQIDKIFLDLKDDGLLKYSGIKEFIEQKPTKTIKTGIIINGKYQYKYFTNHAKDILMFVNKTLKYPIVEKIVKEGLAEELVNSDKTAVSKTLGQKVIQVNLKAKTVPEAFGITKSLLRYYKSAKKKLGCAITMQTLQELYSLDNNIVGEDAYWLDKHNVPIENIVKLQKVLPEMTVSKITSYLERVRIGQMFDAVPASEQWRDYLDACKSIGMDMHDNHVLYPRALKTEHDIVMAKQKFIADESLNSDFVKAVERYRFLEYHKDDYFIKIPESMEAMFEEGRKLKHCCGRYVDDVIEKTAFVLFLRRKINPEEPFLSIEVSPDMTVHQVRGINDSYVSVQKDAMEVNKFLHSWAKMKHLCLDIR